MATKKIKKQISSIELKSQTAPTFTEKRGADWIEYSGEEFHNNYPSFLLDLYYSSATHAAVVNTTAELIAGEDIEIADTDNIEAKLKLTNFCKNPNSKETLHELIKKLAFDFKLQGGYCLNIIWSQDRQTISEIHHVSMERVRVGIPNALGKTDCYYVSADWSNTRENEPVKIPAFDPNNRTSPSQLLYAGSYSPGMDAYYLPDYLAGNNWMLIDAEIAQWHLANVQNSFSGTMVVSMANGIPSERERLEIEKSLNNKFTGSANAGKVILTFSDDNTRTPQITPVQMPNADKQYETLQKLIQANVLTSHRVTSPLLVGIRDSGGGLGNNAQEMTEAFDLYLNSVVIGYQKQILKTLSKILSINDIDLPLTFIQAKPVSNKFTIDDLRSVMTTSEIREELGLPELEESEDTSKEELKKVGEIDNESLFDTIEEAEAEAERIGCKGYHEHKQDGKTYYMPCSDHDTATTLSKVNKDLQNFINLGEEIDEDKWELYSDTEVEDEIENFDFEADLHNLTRVELVGTGRAYPEARSPEGDKTSKQEDYKDDLYRVRYTYYGPGGERDFCSAMKAANKVYRKEDIIAMGSAGVNPGFGPGGSKNYSIWKYKGGVNCYHSWRRKIYVSKDGNISNVDKIISTTEARSRGVNVASDSPLVATPPIYMPNQGRKN